MMNDSLVSVELPTTLDLEPVTLGDDAPSDPSESAGRYALGETIGEGGMGTVYAARDSELRRTVAVKVATRADSRRKLGRFVAEAQITAQLEHPNIVPVYDLGLADGRIYYAMRLIDGVHLTDLLKRPEDDRDGWTRHRLLGAFAQVCRAVTFAHERGGVHRDLKPENLVFGTRGEVQVVDWGLARAPGSPGDVVDEVPAGAVEQLFAGGSGHVAVQRSSDAASSGGSRGDVEMVKVGRTQDGAVLGTPGYMAPEQALGMVDRVDARSDVWALGAILYEILTDGVAACPGPSTADRLAQNLRLELWDPRRIEPLRDIPEELALASLRAMSRRAEDRHTSALELAEEVEAWLDGRRRKEAAERLLAQARKALAAALTGRKRALGLRGEARAALGVVMPGAPEADKLDAWTKQEEADALDRQADLDEVRFEQLAHAALERFDGLSDAHALLADHYQASHAAAEARRDPREAARFELLLRTHDRGRHAEWLTGQGVLTLHTDPPGARVELQRWVVRGRRLQLEDVPSPGVTPLRNLSLPVGSYLATLTADGREPVRYPFEVKRASTWRTSAPGSEASTPVPLPAAGTLGADDVHVPASWGPTGGDPAGPGSLPARDLWVDGFVIRRFPVTNREYVDFLNALVDAGRSDDAARWQPRATAAGEDLGAGLFVRDGERFALPDGVGPHWPVASVDWASASAYADWKAAADGLPWRLPSELEWERAARGVDERFFPWGYDDDGSWRLTVESHLGPPSPEPVTGHPTDCSPYGVRGLAGGVRDWVLEEFAPTGPEVSDDGALLITEVRNPDGAHGTRGGAWSLPDWVGRACVRGFHPPIHLPDLGFRLARSL